MREIVEKINSKNTREVHMGTTTKRDLKTKTLHTVQNKKDYRRVFDKLVILNRTPSVLFGYTDKLGKNEGEVLLFFLLLLFCMFFCLSFVVVLVLFYIIVWFHLYFFSLLQIYTCFCFTVVEK